MKTRFALPLVLSVILGVTACGGDKPASTAPAGGQQQGQQPAGKPDQPASDAAAPAPKPAAQKPAPPVRLDMVMVKAFFGSEPSAPTVDNPSTPEKVALGKMLFHEQGLSKNGNLSCASCHDLANYGQDGKPTSPGSDGKNGTRNTPTVYNAFRQYAQFWDARAATVEEQAIMPMLNPVEHGVSDEADLLSKIKAKPELVAAFGKAFPGVADAVTAANFKLAIGAFERTLVTKSKFDRFLDGDNRAFSNEEKLGLKTFMDAMCTQCHMSRLVGGSMIQKLGVYGSYPSTDTGRMEVTKSESDKFMFKVSSLLNVEKTAPYYHDGKIATLEEAVKDMAILQLNKKLTDAEVASIVTFLKTLTGPLPAEFAK